jgi:ACR3 family arsenite efflux pump ArsB
VDELVALALLAGLGFLDRFLAFWVLIAMILGVVIGNSATPSRHVPERTVLTSYGFGMTGKFAPNVNAVLSSTTLEGVSVRTSSVFSISRSGSQLIMIHTSSLIISYRHRPAGRSPLLSIAAPHRQPVSFESFRSPSSRISALRQVMMWPILTKVQYEKLPQIFATSRIWYQVGISLILNWIIGPFVRSPLLPSFMMS